MGKVKNLEKKDKSAAEFDQKTPANRVKSINDAKLKKKSKQKNKISVVGGEVEKEVKPLVKEAKKEIAKALKAKANLTKVKTEEKSKDEYSVEIPEQLATREIVKKAVKSAKEAIDKAKEGVSTKTLFDDELRYGLQVVATKVPKSPPHTKKILLQHSLFGDEQPDICFIIRDQKLKKTEFIVDETVLAFEAKLKELGITGIKAILPLSKLKQDYGPNNMKLKLLNMYDLFLVESEIAEHTYSILGKHFIKKRKRPLQIDTNKPEIMKTSIENAKRKVSFKISSNSNFSIFEVGIHKMENSKIVDNILTAIEQLKDKWPGGWKNVLRLYLKPMQPSKVSIPIYYSKINPNDVEVPVEVGVKQTRLDKINEMLTRRSKKLRIDKKTKKVVKVKGPALGSKKENKTGKQKKDKKRKLGKDDEVVKVETTAEEPKKKKKKTSESEKPAVSEVAEPKKKKKKNSESTVPVTEAEIPEAAVSEKPKKKKKSNPEPDTTDVKPVKKIKTAPVAAVAPEETQKGKKKNKGKKSKAL